jgi:hypothetical protein
MGKYPLYVYPPFPTALLPLAADSMDSGRVLYSTTVLTSFLLFPVPEHMTVQTKPSDILFCRL